MGEKLHDIGLTTTGRKCRQTGLSKLKKICVSKDTIKRVKRQPMGWEKILTNHMYNRKLISRICKELIKLSNNEKIVKDWNRHFSKECILMANKHTKRCSISLTTREIQIKTTMRHHFIPIGMAVTKGKKNRLNRLMTWM